MVIGDSSGGYHLEYFKRTAVSDPHRKPQSENRQSCFHIKPITKQMLIRSLSAVF